eukprot:TRINITY_DN1629_c0_g3_i1.p1 TRINITY_DN1629_c0_g3~~TRINITY_DN1629_c0_g3_i1.p1  ORF type:complete len:601 (+),score=71.09 TRINITY_DN1629_c0_g3_i1:41-1843(+)
MASMSPPAPEVPVEREALPTAPSGTTVGRGLDTLDLELGDDLNGDVVKDVAGTKTEQDFDPEQVVTAVIEFTVSSTVDNKQVEEFMDSMYLKMASFRGFIRRDVVRAPIETGTAFTVVIAFDNYENLRVWLSSKEREEALKTLEVQNREVSEQKADDVIRINHRLGENLRKPMSARPAPKWKLAIVVYCVVAISVFCIDQAGLNRGLGLVIESFCLKIAITIAVLVPVLTYAVLPLTTAILRRWLLAPRPRYTNHVLRVLDEGLDLFLPRPPALDDDGVNKLLDRVSRLEGAIYRLRSRQTVSSNVEDFSRSPSVKEKAFSMLDRSASGLKSEKLSTPQHKDGDTTFPVSLVVHHHVKWEFEEEFANWCAEIKKEMARWPGFVGLTTLHGQADGLSYTQEFVNISKFRSWPELEAFVQSQERLHLLERLVPMLESDSQYKFEDSRMMLDAFSELFVNSGDQAPARPPPVWKTCFLTACGLLMCVWPVSENIGPALHHWGVTQSWAKTLIISFINVSLNTWVCVPLLLFFFGGWLNKPRETLATQSCVGRFLDRGFPRVVLCCRCCHCFDMWLHLFGAVLAFGALIVLIVVDPIAYPQSSS